MALMARTVGPPALAAASLSLFAGLPLSGCADDGEPSAAGAPGAPTFYEDVAPILATRCQGCHSPGQIAPIPLTSYAEARLVSKQIAEQTIARTMPPWGAFETGECQPRNRIRGDLHLTTEQIATLAAWHEAGAPEGDPSAAPPAGDPPSGLPSYDLQVEPTSPFTVGGERDQFRCFVMDPKLTEPRYADGFNVIVGNPEVVHHILVYVDPERASEAKMDASGGYDCFGSPGARNASTLFGWAPGMSAVTYDGDVGMLVPANALLIMQVHYHPAGREAVQDSTGFQMRFHSNRPAELLQSVLVGNESVLYPNGDGLLPGPSDEGGVEFRIPAGVAGHVERMQYTVPALPVPLRVYGLAHHMHYLGTDLKTTVEHAAPAQGEPKEECILETPQWDFTWQRTYLYDAPSNGLPELRSGDVLKLRCTYDNTMENPFLRKALAEQRLPSPVDVRLGEETLDEMCIAGLLVLRPNL